jgi:hypothetical protein
MDGRAHREMAEEALLANKNTRQCFAVVLSAITYELYCNFFVASLASTV